jgi:transcriptional regulator
MMYVPAHFDENRVPVLHEAIRRIGFGTLVTLGDGGIEASHVPMLIDAEPPPSGTITGHLARANPQWRSIKYDVEALAIFTGADSYVSPSWYATRQQTGKVVPTWNYIAIHARGRLRFFDNRESLRRVVTRLTDKYETPRTAPWRVTDAPADYIDAMLKAIVGFELTITQLEGKWKMSQNQPVENRAGVVQGLTQEGKTDVAALVAATMEPKAGN